MPPAISDEEMDDDIDDVDVPEEVPARKVTKATAAAVPAKKGRKLKAAEAEPEEEEEEAEEDGDEDDEEGEDEYQVEKILSHDFTDKGAVLYRIMWLGYPKEEDFTWEPVENLSGAKEILDAYHKSIGGAPTRKKGAAASAKGAKNNKRAASATDAAEGSPAPPAKKRGRKSNGAAESSGAAKSSSNELPLGLWEDDVQRVTAIIEDTEQGGTVSKVRDIKSLKGLLEWNSGRKTEHAMDVLRQKCPQRLLDYYEQHLPGNPIQGEKLGGRHDPDRLDANALEVRID